MKIIIVLILALIPTQSSAMVPQVGDCYPYDEVAAALATTVGETSDDRTLVKRTQTGLEVFISERGSLTVVEVMPTGLTCFRAWNNGAPENGTGWGAPPKNMEPL